MAGLFMRGGSTFMPKAWPHYGSNFSSGTTDAIGILVEQFNDLEMALSFVLLMFMRGDVLSNKIVTEHLSSLATIEAIKSYLGAPGHKDGVKAATTFAIDSFETCRVNRNSIIHFQLAWREKNSRITRLMRVRAKNGRFAYHATLKVGDVRRVADDCHSLRRYLDELTTALHGAFHTANAFAESARPNKPKALSWAKKPYM